MPTQHNESEWNLFLNMPGGYLQILYPTPTACLDLQAWQEFYGFDQEGQEGLFDININTENFTMEFRKLEKVPMSLPRERKKNRYTLNLEELRQVKTRSMVLTDFYGNPVEEELRLPGPFVNLDENKVISIDPGKL